MTKGFSLSDPCMDYLDRGFDNRMDSELAKIDPFHIATQRRAPTRAELNANVIALIRNGYLDSATPDVPLETPTGQIFVAPWIAAALKGIDLPTSPPKPADQQPVWIETESELPAQVPTYIAKLLVEAGKATRTELPSDPPAPPQAAPAPVADSAAPFRPRPVAINSLPNASGYSDAELRALLKAGY